MENRIDRNLHEIVDHGSASFPLAIYKNKFVENRLSYISTHWHNEIEIVYCTEGNILYTTNEKEYLLDQDSFITVNQNMLHQADMRGNATWYAILFDPKLIYGHEESRIKDLLNNIKFKHILLRDKYLIKKIKSLIALYEDTKNELYELVVRQALTEIYIEILKLILINIPQDEDTASPYTEKVHRMIEYIHLNYQDKISIDSVAQYGGLCRSDACRFFRDSFKTSIGDYIIRLRIEKSIKLLMTDNMSISEIAMEVGFNSSSYYTETFKKVLGQTPAQYKKKSK